MSNESSKITVTGEASQAVTPDEARVSFGVETFAPTLAKATTSSEESSKMLVTAIKKLGLKDCHIQMAALTVEIRYESNYNEPVAAIKGYVTRRSYHITLEKNFLEMLEQVIAAGLNNGANRLSSVESSVVQIAKQRDEVWRKAIRAAHEKAELLAGELGMKVGKPLRISEYKGAESAPMAAFSYGGGSPDSSTGSMPLGTVQIDARVQVEFELLTK